MTPTPPIRVLLADDQVLVRAGIAALLRKLPGYEVVAECADGHSALEALQRQHPDVAILDIAMPGCSGIEAVRAARRLAPDVRLLFLSGIETESVVAEALRSGADGYLLKDFALAELELALAAVRRGERYLSPRISAQLLQQLGSPQTAEPTLSPRQTQVLRLIAQGSTTKEIARSLQLSPKTVEFHRSQLMDRLDLHDVASLTRYAMSRGLVEGH